jgi:hypothetical protein
LRRKPLPSRETQPSVEQERISSSVAIHWIPALAIVAMIPWHTEPSEGHMPRGFAPKTFS